MRRPCRRPRGDSTHRPWPCDPTLEFDVVAGAVADRADTWDLIGAMYLVEGYVSDDSFRDFCDGLILLDRDHFERSVADPDSLAGHPLVLTAAARKPLPAMDGVVSFESISSCVCDAWLRVTRGNDEDDFWVAREAVGQTGASSSTDVPGPRGTRWDVSDGVEARRRLPRLAALFGDRRRLRSGRTRSQESGP